MTEDEIIEREVAASDSSEARVAARLKAEWWASWDPSPDAPPADKPPRKYVEYALGRWGDPPPEWCDYVERMARGEAVRGKGAGRRLRLTGPTGLFTHFTYAWCVSTLVKRDGLTVEKAIQATARAMHASPSTVRKHYYGEGGVYAQKDSEVLRWAIEAGRWAPVGEDDG